ncbi:MAG TPA: ketoacyl-ACP synthase III [Bacteroidetes bacterium]|nr:ketoacyl-ACP synthase III [Bacteroidota bacterium]
MYNSKIAGVGRFIPEKVITNHDLEKMMDTSNEWIIERTGIEERHWLRRGEDTSSTMGAKAARMAIEQAGIQPEDVDFIIFATLSPDFYFPGNGVLLQKHLGITGQEVAALDIRNQCSGFIYGLEVADQFIKTGKYKNVLLVGAEYHSGGLDISTRGRGISVLFGDGAGAVVLQPTEDSSKGILTTHIHSNGENAEILSAQLPGLHGGYYAEDDSIYGFDESTDHPFVLLTQKMLDDNMIFPYMDGQAVFKSAVKKFPEVINEGLKTAGYTTKDVKLVIPHQANLRISQFVQRILRLTDDQMFNNIQKYGNTTAASIPIALSEVLEQGKLKEGDLLVLAAFGSGFTWGSAVIRW